MKIDLYITINYLKYLFPTYIFKLLIKPIKFIFHKIYKTMKVSYVFTKPR